MSASTEANGSSSSRTSGARRAHGRWRPAAASHRTAARGTCAPRRGDPSPAAPPRRARSLAPRGVPRARSGNITFRRTVSHGKERTAVVLEDERDLRAADPERAGRRRARPLRSAASGRRGGAGGSSSRTLTVRRRRASSPSWTSKVTSHSAGGPSVDVALAEPRRREGRALRPQPRSRPNACSARARHRRLRSARRGPAARRAGRGGSGRSRAGRGRGSRRTSPGC